MANQPDQPRATPDQPPAEVTHLARQRGEARRAGDFATADRLKADIESLGWKVIDQGTDHRLVPGRAPDDEVGGKVRYGASASVPSVLGEPASAPLTVVLTEGANVASPSPATHVVHLASTPPADTGDDELLLLAPDLGLAAAWNAGLRRARGELIALFAPGVGTAAATGATLQALADHLDDATVAATGTHGLASADLRQWQPASAGEVDALGPGVLMFRRADAADRGPLDEQFKTAHHLAIWWSLVLRDEGEQRPPRRAVALAVEGENRASSPLAGLSEPPDRAARRDFYRLLDHFGRRYDLLREPIRPTAGSAKAQRQRR